jgi:tetratricopeptide (TPR) repeat protein
MSKSTVVRLCMASCMVLLSLISFSQDWQMLRDSARFAKRIRQYDKAVDFYTKSENAIPADSINTLTHALLCDSIGALYLSLNDFKNTEHYYYKALPVYKKLFGEESVKYAGKLQLIAYCELQLMNIDRSDSLYAIVLPLFEKLFTKDNLNYAAACYNYAFVLHYQNNYKKCEALNLEALRIYEKLKSENAIEVSQVCNRLGMLFIDIGEYELAEKNYLRALNIHSNLRGKDYLYTGYCNNLAMVYCNVGDYKKAEPLYLESIEIIEKMMGKESEDYVMVSRHLGSLYHSYGDYPRAEKYYKEALDITEKMAGKELGYALCLRLLAENRISAGELKEAEKNLLEAKSIIKQSGDGDNFSYAQVLHTLGNLYLNNDDNKNAEIINKEANVLIAKLYGENHPNFAISCKNLGILYMDMAQYDKALEYLIKSRDLLAKKTGIYNEEYTNALWMIYNTYHLMGSLELARQTLDDVVAVNKVIVDHFFQFTNETEKNTFIKNIVGGLDSYFSFYVQNFPLQTGKIYNAALMNRNMILNSIQEIKKLGSKFIDGSGKKAYTDWVKSNERLSNLYTNFSEDKIDEIREVEEIQKMAEKKLASLSAEFKFHKQQKQQNWTDIQAALKPGQAAIEFLDYNVTVGPTQVFILL